LAFSDVSFFVVSAYLSGWKVGGQWIKKLYCGCDGFSLGSKLSKPFSAILYSSWPPFIAILGGKFLNSPLEGFVKS
jgi:hypothetical protein